MRQAIAVCAIIAATLVPIDASQRLRTTASAVTDAHVATGVAPRALGEGCAIYGWGRNKNFELLQPQGTESKAGVNMKTYFQG